MGISLSGGDYQYNRFDAYEASLEENRQAAMSAGESEGKKMMGSAGKPAKVTGGKSYTMMGKDGKPLFKEGKDASNPEEMKKKVDKAGKKAKKTGRHLSHEDEKEEGEEEVSTADGGSDGGGAMGEELNSKETGNTVMEDQMARYSRALGMMGKHYSGPTLEEKKELPDFLKKKEDKDEDKKEDKKDSKGKKADKDYDGDGEVESSKEEYFGSKDKAIKKAMAKEEVAITKEMVVEYLVSEGYASNEVSAEILHTHVSDEFLAQIEERMISE